MRDLSLPAVGGSSTLVLVGSGVDASDTLRVELEQLGFRVVLRKSLGDMHLVLHDADPAVVLVQVSRHEAAWKELQQVLRDGWTLHSDVLVLASANQAEAELQRRVKEVGADGFIHGDRGAAVAATELMA